MGPWLFGIAVVAALLSAAVVAGSEQPELVMPPDMPRDEAARLRDLAERAAVTGRVTTERFRLPANVFEYLLDHPEFAATVARALRIASYRVWREGTEMWLDDGQGAVGRFAFVHTVAGSRIVYARGRYTRWMIPIRGDAVAVLTWSSEPSGDGRMLIAPALTGFVRLENVVVDAVARLLRRAATSKAEQMARKLLADFAAAARMIDAEPGRVLDALRAHPDVAPADLEGFRRLVEPRRGLGYSPRNATVRPPDRTVASQVTAIAPFTL